MRGAWLRHLIVAAAVVSGSAAWPAEPPSAEDYLRVLTNGPWPLEILAFCYSTVDKEPLFREAGGRWRARNDGLLASVEAKSAVIDIPADVRRAADAAALAAIRRLVARQYDKPAWCRTIAAVIDGGAYDVDRRSDLEGPLKRIFGRP